MNIHHIANIRIGAGKHATVQTITHNDIEVARGRR